MNCLLCDSGPKFSPDATGCVFITIEDTKGEFDLCSKCWLEQQHEEELAALPTPELAKRKPRRRRR